MGVLERSARSRTARTARSTRRPTPRCAKNLVDGSVPANTVAFVRAVKRRAAAGTSTASRPATKPMSTRRRSRSRRSRRPESRGRTPICGPGSRTSPTTSSADGAWESFAPTRPELDVDRDLRDHCRRLRSGIAVLAQRRSARTHRTAVHRRRWSGCGRSRTRASRRRPMRAASTARATRSVSARSRRASRSRRSGGDGSR